MKVYDRALQSVQQWTKAHVSMFLEIKNKIDNEKKSESKCHMRSNIQSKKLTFSLRKGKKLNKIFPKNREYLDEFLTVYF